MKKLRMSAAVLTAGMLLAGCGNDVVTETGWEAEYITVEYRAEEANVREAASEKTSEKDATLIAVLDFGSREHTYKVIVEPFTKDAMKASFEIVRKEIKRLAEGWGRYSEILHTVKADD